MERCRTRPIAHVAAEAGVSRACLSKWKNRARAIAVWNVHYNYHRPHTAAGNCPPAARLHVSVINLMASNS
uniref:Truncated IS481 family transposase n=1 Tax=Streptomyces caniferus TaxID=285557 RepID=A0A493R199_9ACTN|nr:truncated IS481 family transposase [Streptomyces caniferus]